MRIDRLLAIVTYLLNREKATCAQLAGEFEVSERTIQRDIDTINMAGIPISSERGTYGGYKILDTYGFSKQSADAKDIEHIKQSLLSLNTVLEDKTISDTLEKIKSLHGESDNNPVRVDFSIAREKKEQNEALVTIRKIITNNGAVEFYYTNGSGKGSSKVVEPIGLEFRWYAWYMVAYDKKSQDYRIFKLIRMDRIRVIKAFSGIDHGNPARIFNSLIEKNASAGTVVHFVCSKSSLSAIKEYLSVVDLEKVDDETFRGSAYVLEEERLWFAFILSLGDGIKIVSPEHIRTRIVEQAKKILKSYDK